VAAGLSLTQFGKDLINSVGSQSKGLIGNIGTSSDVKKDSSTPQQAGTNAAKALANAKPIQTIVLDGEASKQYPMTLSGCLEKRDELKPLLRLAELEQTQSVVLCKGKTIANPKAEWKCEFKPEAKICLDREAYACSVQYQCVPETAAYNREKFKKQLEGLS